MQKQPTTEEMGVLIQSAYDCKKSTDRPQIDYVLLKEELAKFNQYPDKGMYAVSFKMTSSGGSINVLGIERIDKLEDGRRYGEFNSDYHVLVEPKGYGDIEPYNRQPPFYVPKSYAIMKHEFYEHGNFMVYKSEPRTARIFTCVDEYYFNSVWGIYTHVVYVHNILEAEKVIDKIIEIAIGKKEEM